MEAVKNLARSRFRKTRLTPYQIDVLSWMVKGVTIAEFYEPVEPFYRTLGPVVKMKLKYRANWTGSPKVRYSTFHRLFKSNLIGIKRMFPSYRVEFEPTQLGRDRIVVERRSNRGRNKKLR